MARSLLPICAAAIAVILPAVAPAAFAQSREAAQAADHFDEASSLFNRGEVALACRAFEQSYREDAAPGTLFNMAVCHEAEGLLADAYRELDLLARRAEAVGRTEQAATMRRREALLQPRLARIDLVHLSARRAEVTGISLDDSPVLPEDWIRPLYVTPQAHVLHFRYGDGSAQDRSTGALVAGSTTSVTMDEPAPAPEGAPSSPGTRRTAAYATGGAGLALLAAGAAFGVGAIVQKHKADGTCPPGGCLDPSVQQTAYDRRSDAITDATLATIGIAAGGAALATGLFLLLTGGHSDARDPTSSWTFVPVGGPRGAGLGLEASF